MGAPRAPAAGADPGTQMIKETLLTSRWLVRSVLAVLAIIGCLMAANWQWERSQQQLEAEQAALAEPVAITEVVAPGREAVPIEALGRRVTVTGEFLPGAHTMLRSRTSQEGEPGFWSVDGVRTDDGAVVAVLRGWSPDPTVAEPRGPVEVSGRLQPDENFYPDAPISESGPLVTVTAAGLRTQWADVLSDGGDSVAMTPGFVSATRVSPPAADLEPLVPLIGSDPEIAFPLRNVLYSLQWLVFVGFIVVIWVRWLREDVGEARAAREAAAMSGDAPDRVSLDS